MAFCIISELTQNILNLKFGFDCETTCAFLPPSEQWKI